LTWHEEGLIALARDKEAGRTEEIEELYRRFLDFAQRRAYLFPAEVVAADVYRQLLGSSWLNPPLESGLSGVRDEMLLETAAALTARHFEGRLQAHLTREPLRSPHGAWEINPNTLTVQIMTSEPLYATTRCAGEIPRSAEGPL